MGKSKIVVKVFANSLFSGRASSCLYCLEIDSSSDGFFNNYCEKTKREEYNEFWRHMPPMEYDEHYTTCFDVVFGDGTERIFEMRNFVIKQPPPSVFERLIIEFNIFKKNIFDFIKWRC